MVVGHFREHFLKDGARGGHVEVSFQSDDDSAFMLSVLVQLQPLDVAYRRGHFLQLGRVDLLVLHRDVHAGSQEIVFRDLASFLQWQLHVSAVDGQSPEKRFKAKPQFVLNATEDEKRLLEIDLMSRHHRPQGGALAGTAHRSLDFAFIALSCFGLRGIGFLLSGAGPGERVSVLHIANNINFIPRPI